LHFETRRVRLAYFDTATWSAIAQEGELIEDGIFSKGVAMDIKKYRVRLVRPVFQSAIVEVDATSEDDAIFEAIIQADSVPEQAWDGTFDSDSYFYDVHYVQEVTETDDVYLNTEIDDDRKYLLLRGDIDSGTGALPFQPWMTEISELVVADLCTDWSDELATLERAGVASYYASLDRQIKAKVKELAKVIPFRRPEGPGEEA
jgi:hypothetical protein